MDRREGRIFPSNGHWNCFFLSLSRCLQTVRRIDTRVREDTLDVSFFFSLSLSPPR